MESKLSPRLVFALGQKRTDGGLHNSRWRRGSPLPPTGGFGEFKRSGSPHSGSSGDIWEEQPRQTEQPIRFLPPGLAWKSESYFRERKKKKRKKKGKKAFRWFQEVQVTGRGAICLGTRDTEVPDQQAWAPPPPGPNTRCFPEAGAKYAWCCQQPNCNAP